MSGAMEAEPDVSEMAVAVGSVGHILRSTFKNLFPEDHEEEPDEGAQGAEEADAGDADAVGEGEEGGDGEAGADGAGDDAAPDPDETAAVEEPTEGGEDAENGEGGADGPSGDEAKREPEEEEPEDVRLAKLAAAVLDADEVQQDVDAAAEERAAEQVEEIERQLQERVAQSGELEDYLKKQRKTAVDEDSKEAERLRQRGLIMNSEVPQGPSNLRLEEGTIREYGRFGSSLIVARKLLEETEMDALERNGQLPKDDLDIPDFTHTKGQPHYLASTATLQVRQKMQAEKVERAVKLRDTKRAARAASRTTTPKPKKTVAPEDDLDEYEAGKRAAKPKLAPGEGLTGDEMEAEEKVLHRMTHKLNFLRNPRFQKGATAPMGTNMGGSISNTSKGIGGAPKGGRSGTPTGLKVSDDFFDVHPKEVVFTDYVANQEYTKVLILRNQSALGRNLRILPPTTPFFSMDVAKFPTSGGMVAPGMSVKVKLRFRPNSLADFHDHIAVITEQKKFNVTVRSYRPPPVLTLPSIMDAGNCMQGDRLEQPFTVFNKGGIGSFKIFSEEAWPHVPPAHELGDQLDVGPFRIWPTNFSLKGGESMELNLRFLPKGVGAYERRFVLVCDNCEVTTYTVVGVSCTVDVVVTEMQNRILPAVPIKPLLDAETGGAASVSIMSARSEAATSVDGGDVGAMSIGGASSVAMSPPRPPRSNGIASRVSTAPPPSVPGLSLAPEVSVGGPAELIPVSLAQEMERPPMRLRFDPLAVGSLATKTFTLSNRTPLELKYSWKLTNWSRKPPAPPKRKRHHRHGYGGLTNRSNLTTARSGGNAASMSMKASMYSVKDGASTGRGDASPSPKHMAPHSTTAGDAATELDMASAFEVYPAAGVMQPHGTLSFSVTCAPQMVDVFECVARFIVHDMPKKPSEDSIDSTAPAGSLAVVHEGQSAASHSRSDVPGEEGSKDIESESKSLLTAQDAPIEREEVTACSMYVQASGREAEVTVSPPSLHVPGSLLPGGVAAHRVRLTNYGAASTRFEFGDARMTDPQTGLALPAQVGFGDQVVPRLLVPSSEEAHQPADASAPQVRVTPSVGTVPPNGSCEVEVIVVARTVGEFDMSVPCSIENGPSVSLPLHAVVEGPRCAILDPEVDFGLVGVGGHMQREVRFKNLSGITARWSFVQTAADQLMSSPTHSVASPVATARSMDSMGPSRASLAFEPPVGELGPNEEAVVMVSCHAGSQPQRLREMFECRVEHGNTSYCRVRGEVQSPKVYLDTFSLRLGACFVGVPVKREVKLKNLSNLLADWAFDTSPGMTDTEFFRMEFEPSQGTLTEKGEQKVAVTFHPKKPGKVESLFACDVRGMAFPLGFIAKGYTKGLVVVLSLDDPYAAERELKAKLAAEEANANAVAADPAAAAAAPLGIADAGKSAAGVARATAQLRKAQVRAHHERDDADVDPVEVLEQETVAAARAAGGEIGVVPSVNFGNDFPTFGSRKMTLRLHNCSGIPTSFTVQVEKYAAPDVSIDISAPSLTQVVGGDPALATGAATLPAPPTRAASSSSSPNKRRSTMKSGTSAIGESTRARKLLGTMHEKKAKFQSNNGMTMLVERDNKQWMEQLLDNGKGLAVDLKPTGARRALPEWGIVEIEVTCVGDMPGTYRDAIVIDVEGQDNIRVPLSAGIIGSPLQLVENVVGLQLNQPLPLLTWGHTLIGTKPKDKTFLVRNTAPKFADVVWSVKPDHKQEPPVVTLAWNVLGGFDSDAPLHIAMEPYSDDLAPPPFEILPAKARIPPRGVVSFTVAAKPEPPVDLTGGNATARSMLSVQETPAGLPLPNGENLGILSCDALFHPEEPTLPIGVTEEDVAIAADAAAAAEATQVLEDDSRSDAGASAAKSATSSRRKRSLLGGKAARRRSSAARRSSTSSIAGSVVDAPVPTKMPACIRVRAAIDPVLPYLSIDKRHSKGGIPFVKFGVWTTHPRGHASYTRQITLTNSLSAPLTFSLDISGPFSLVRTVSNAPIHPLSMERSASDLHRPQSATSGSKMFTLPPQYNVVCDVEFLPKVALQSTRGPSAATIQAPLPGAGDVSAAASTVGASEMMQPASTSVLDSGAAKLKYSFEGFIKATFSNGHSQDIGVRADYLRPMVAASKARHNFGHCHTEGAKTFTLFLANPTEVDAEWTIEHVPTPPPKPRVTIDVSSLGLDDVKGIDLDSLAGAGGGKQGAVVEEDDPDVFYFSEDAGTLTGPTAPLQVADTLDLRTSVPDGTTALKKLTVSFDPDANVHYKSRFRFKVRKGEGFDLILRGHGSYMEEEVVIDGRPGIGPVED